MPQLKDYCISASASYNDFVSFHNFRNREGRMKPLKRKVIALFTVFVLLLIGASPRLQSTNSDPPNEIVKLVFIHHSTGENWLTDDYGDLGRTLDENNYFVSDTNYGWGPEAIGDRTDIPNWTEWFSSGNTPTFMEALFNETEQHSSYTRTLPDPGGENQIIMFKSCFPNSALEGNPNDPPGSHEELTVSGAKYVYNTILQYFATRPDKLFVIITAPPLSDPTYAENARAFNQWLLNDWLNENNYTLNNVAVFDFYNILTDPNAHHRVDAGQIEYISGGSNILYYPSDDDHPSVEGSQKATAEFVPALNTFYHRWKENAPISLAPETGSTAQEQSQPKPVVITSATIDNFDSGVIPGTYGWEAFHDEATSTTMACGTESGTGRNGNTLKLDFNIAANSWGTCALIYESPQNWSAGNGLVFYFRASQAGVYFDIDLYAGPEENRETYLYTIESPAESVNDWVMMELRWEEFHRASWEENPDTIFAKADQITGMAFGIGTPPDTASTQTIWVDDLSLLGLTLSSTESVQPESTEEPAPADQPNSPSLPCTGALILPMSVIIGLSVLSRKRR
jgi:hypothetical protein